MPIVIGCAYIVALWLGLAPVKLDEGCRAIVFVVDALDALTVRLESLILCCSDVRIINRRGCFDCDATLHIVVFVLSKSFPAQLFPQRLSSREI